MPRSWSRARLRRRGDDGARPQRPRPARSEASSTSSPAIGGELVFVEVKAIREGNLAGPPARSRWSGRASAPSCARWRRRGSASASRGPRGAPLRRRRRHRRATARRRGWSTCAARSSANALVYARAFVAARGGGPLKTSSQLAAMLSAASANTSSSPDPQSTSSVDPSPLVSIRSSPGRPGSRLRRNAARVGDRLERAAVQPRGAVAEDRLAVARGRVADVLGEPELREVRVGVVHVAVPRDLGDHRGGRDRGAATVAADHLPVLDRAVAAERKPSTRQTAPGRATALEAAPQRGDVGHVQAAGVDPADAADGDGDALGRADDDRVDRLALAPRVRCLESSRSPRARRSRRLRRS